MALRGVVLLAVLLAQQSAGGNGVGRHFASVGAGHSALMLRGCSLHRHGLRLELRGGGCGSCGSCGGSGACGGGGKQLEADDGDEESDTQAARDILGEMDGQEVDSLP
jgi:hypothetical protein